GQALVLLVEISDRHGLSRYTDRDQKARLDMRPARNLDLEFLLMPTCEIHRDFRYESPLMFKQNFQSAFRWCDVERFGNSAAQDIAKPSLDIPLLNSPLVDELGRKIN